MPPVAPLPDAQTGHPRQWNTLAESGFLRLPSLLPIPSLSPSLSPSPLHFNQPPLLQAIINSVCPAAFTGLTNPQPSQNTRSSVAPANDGAIESRLADELTGCHAARYLCADRNRSRH